MRHLCWNFLTLYFEIIIDSQEVAKMTVFFASEKTEWMYFYLFIHLSLTKISEYLT